MIIAESPIKVTCSQYKLRVQCLATRRLTTIEWIIMNCISRFSKDDELKEKSLGFIFENVLKITNNDFLIKPCIDNMHRLGTIEVKNEEKISPSDLKLENITLTDDGMSMLKEGLIAGDKRSEGADVFYNPLTGEMNSYAPQKINTKEALFVVDKENTKTNFPKEDILQGLRGGRIKEQRFVASKYRVEDIDLNAEIEYEDIMNLIIGFDEHGRLYTKPEIINGNIIDAIRSIVSIPGIDERIMNNIPNGEYKVINNILGSGIKIKQKILDVAREGKIIFIHDKLYKAYKNNKTAFKDKTVICFSSEKFLIEKKDNLIIHIPVSFIIEDCLIINEKQHHVNLRKSLFFWKNSEVLVPLAYNDLDIFRNIQVANWLENVINENYSKDIRYLALYGLPIFFGKQISIEEKINGLWTNSTEPLEELFNLQSIDSEYNIICGKHIDISRIFAPVINSIRFGSWNEALMDIESILSLSFIKNSTKNFNFCLAEIFSKCSKIESYKNLHGLYSLIRKPQTVEEVSFKENCETLYTEELMIDILKNIVKNKYEILPSYCDYDDLFNELNEAIINTQLLMNNFSLFSKSENDKLYSAINKSPAISGLSFYIETLYTLEKRFLSKGIDILSLMEKLDNNVYESYQFNLKVIKALLKEEIIDVADENLRVYVIDTCSLMHQPDILEYFAEDELIRIPTKVMDELGKIKDGHSNKYTYQESKTARELIRKVKNGLVVLNKDNKRRFTIENSNIDLLPIDLDPAVPDNQILSVALKYKDKNPVIISDDGNFSIISISQNITAQTAKEFVNQRPNFKKTIDFESGSLNLIVMEDEDKDKGDTSKELSVDQLPINVISKVDKSITSQIIAYLKQNKITTVGDFRKLTPETVRNFPGNAKKNVYKNTICGCLSKIDSILEKVKNSK